jgi:DNA-binding response OmpR family regulator
MRVLIVDDDEGLAHILAMGLRAEGMAVVVFHSPAKALRHLEGVDVLLTDFHLPEMTGLEMANKAYVLGWRGAFFLMSGHPAEFHDPARGSRCLATLEKPFPLGMLLALLRQVKPIRPGQIAPEPPVSSEEQ